MDGVSNVKKGLSVLERKIRQTDAFFQRPVVVGSASTASNAPSKLRRSTGANVEPLQSSSKMAVALFRIESMTLACKPASAI